MDREAEEKARRSREAREKAEAEKADRAARKMALAAMTVGNSTQEGVMDSLLEALQTGSAFSRDQRRKRPKGNAGGMVHISYISKCISLSTVKGWLHSPHTEPKKCQFFKLRFMLLDRALKIKVIIQ